MIHLYPELVLSIGNPLHFKKNALYLSVIVFSTEVLRLLLETGPLFFYVVIQATQRSNHLQGKGSTFISQLFEDPVSISPTRGIKLTTSRSAVKCSTS